MADFRQYYGTDLPLEVEDADCRRWAMLWHALPRESRCAQRSIPAARWSPAEYMLASCEHELRTLIWQQTKDGQKGRNKPQPIKTPAQVADAEAKRDRALAFKAELEKRNKT